MDKDSRKTIGLFLRYIVLIILGLGNLHIFYYLLTPLTIRSVSAGLNIFSEAVLVDNMIYFNGVIIEIIPACVAGAAFYLLVILTMSTFKIKPLVRAKIIITSITSLFVLNILRILILASFIGSSQFTVLHWMFWHLISTLFIVVIWLSHIKIYKIKTIPIYSDMKYLMGLIKPRKKSKRNKKH
jgi:exosortase/archaeosortase